MRMLRPSTSMKQEQRVRESRGSSEVQTSQLQPITGTPVEVPVPRSVTRMADLFRGRQLQVDLRLSSVPGFLQCVTYRRFDENGIYGFLPQDIRQNRQMYFRRVPFVENNNSIFRYLA